MSYISVGRSLMAAVMVAGCSERTDPSRADTPDFRQVALAFTQALAAREYPQAYAMTSKAYRTANTVDELRAGFEAIVPLDWGDVGPIEVGHTMTRWPDQQPADLGWAYVSIGGDVYSEAVTVVIMAEHGEAKIREIDFGRP